MPSLRIVGGRAATFSIHKRLLSIGASPENDVRLEGEGIAPTHALLQFDGTSFVIQTTERALDLFVNGKARRKERLAHGDRVRVGKIELEFRILDEDRSPDAARDNSAERTEHLAYRKLQEFSERLSDRSDLPSLLDALLDAVIELTHADKGFLLLMEEGVPRVRVARNVLRESIENDLAALSDSIVAKVVRERRPLIVSDALSDAEFSASQSVVNLRLSSVMCVPLLDKGSLLGLLYVGNDRVKNLFDQRTLEVLAVFASQASLLVANAILVSELRLDNRELQARLSESHFGAIVGSCESMREVFRKLDRVATTDISVLITGETGTGKELIAAEIHRRSGRHAQPFVSLNCGAIPENLLESELFGHVRGAFTGATHTRAGKFQAASGGTLFLDEIGEMPLNLQVKLLRVLEERVVCRVGDTRPEPVDIRVVAATHRNLDEAIREGRFREDLYYRLHVVRIHLPPLRERGDDVIVLAKYLLTRAAEQHGAPARGFSPATLTLLRRHAWPGNVRELENRIHRAVVLCDRPLIEPDDLDLPTAEQSAVLPLADAKEEFQRRYITQILERNGGNRTKAARELGVDPRTIFRFLEKEQQS
jgi:transcriptional regulator with GAF, ATPase, and Fis domain